MEIYQGGVFFLNQKTINKIYASQPIMKEALTNYYQNKRINKREDKFFYGDKNDY